MLLLIKKSEEINLREIFRNKYAFW